jgi:integrase
LNEVQPIRDRDKIKEVSDILKAQNHRNYMLFIVGIYTGLRISDILCLKVDQVREREHITIKEKKTSKTKRFFIQPVLQVELKKYIRDKKDNEFLFQSRKGFNQHISREQAYRILKKAALCCGLHEIGTHTLRKTFGYHSYKNDGNLGMVMSLLNHSKEEHTLRYIGITQENQDKARSKLKFEV